MHDDDDSLSCELPDEAATLALGARLAGVLTPGLVVWLEGELGSGKTTLVRGLLRALGWSGKVKSPTFTVAELYAISNLKIHHFDFYRFSEPEEYLDAGLDECFDGKAVCLVEWPQKAGEYLAPADLHIALAVTEDGRRAWLAARSEAGRTCLRRLSGCSGAASSSSPGRR